MADRRVANVTFTGSVPDPETYLGHADLFLFPSRREGYPNALLEVMSADAAVVASRIGGCLDIVKPGETARRRGFCVVTGSLEAADLPRGHCDLAVGWMVLEHLHGPAAALRVLHGAVRPGGWLALSVPDFDCIGQRIFSENWHALQIPAHMTHLTPKTARALLGSALAGRWRGLGTSGTCPVG